MQNLADILKKQVRQSSLWRGVISSLVIKKTNEAISDLFGAEAQKYAQAVYLKENILCIACLSSTMAQEIKLNESKLMKKINGEFGENTIKRIRYLA